MSAPPFDTELGHYSIMFPGFPTLNPANLATMRAGMAAPESIPIEITSKDPAITHSELTIPGSESHEIPISITRYKDSESMGPRPAIYFLHGGGFILGGKLSGSHEMLAWAKTFNAVLIAIEYRLAPEHPSPCGLEDCFTGLKYIFDNAHSLQVDPAQIVIAGWSAGGGLAAGTAIMAKDRRLPKLRAQMLIYPMLDDRMATVSSQQYMTDGCWSGITNLAAWDFYLPGRRGIEGLVAAIEAPARATVEDLEGLPETYIDVGSAEVFRDEAVSYAGKLWEAGVICDLHVLAGAWHGYDLGMPSSRIAQEARAFRLTWAKRIFGTAGTA